MGSLAFENRALDPEIVFDTPIEERYEKALALLGLTPQSIWMTPINE